MAMSLWDHERRLDDLETLLRRLLADAGTRPGGVDLNEMARALRANGAAGAADLLASSHRRPYAR
jgi:hypothetical protein